MPNTVVNEDTILQKRGSIYDKNVNCFAFTAQTVFSKEPFFCNFFCFHHVWKNIFVQVFEHLVRLQSFIGCVCLTLARFALGRIEWRCCRFLQCHWQSAFFFQCHTQAGQEGLGCVQSHSGYLFYRYMCVAPAVINGCTASVFFMFITKWIHTVTDIFKPSLAASNSNSYRCSASWWHARFVQQVCPLLML